MRDAFFKCVKCGQYISTECSNVKHHFIPDSHVSMEENWFEHIECKNKLELKAFKHTQKLLLKMCGGSR